MTLPATMQAVLLTGYGGFDCLSVRDDVPVPRPGPGEVVIRVTAAGMNNTDINTRTGWYSDRVTEGTTAKGGVGGFDVDDVGMGDWSGGIAFPRIQGADVVGRIAAVGPGADAARVGERVVCNPYVSSGDWLQDARFIGADFDGGFAEYTCVPDGNAVAVPDDLPFRDAELASLPCSGGTAMNMLMLSGIRAGDRVLVTGASGGVGTFLIQIAKHYGAEVAAICSADKSEMVAGIGADHVIDRAAPDRVNAVRAAAGDAPFSLIADVVGGDAFAAHLSLLGRGGRYVTAGAIAGPIVELDLRTLYLKNLSFFGSTVYLPETFPQLLELVQVGAIRPAIAAQYPLSEIVAAQTAFLAKSHVGSIVLRPAQRGVS